MEVAVIADGIYRLSAYLQDVAAPAGFTMNQFLIDTEHPLVFHCGHRELFPLLAQAVACVLRVERQRWITFGRAEEDESSSTDSGRLRHSTPKWHTADRAAWLRRTTSSTGRYRR